MAASPPDPPLCDAPPSLDDSGVAAALTPAEQALLEAAVALGRRHQFEEGHGLQVAQLALELFDQLPQLHGLGAGERRLLLAAAVLHDVGQCVSYQGHHKHSLRLLLELELPGLSPREMRLVANVARYHRKREPTPRHPEFARLPAPDRERVRRLAALLRVADALDREHLRRVRRLHAQREGNALLLRVEGAGHLASERWALQKKARLFGRVFGCAVTWCD